MSMCVHEHPVHVCTSVYMCVCIVHAYVCLHTQMCVRACVHVCALDESSQMSSSPLLDALLTRRASRG